MASKADKPQGNEFLDKFTGLFGKADKNLDLVKKEVVGDLKKLKKGETLENVAATIHESALEGFKKDLAEIGVSGEAQKPYLEEFEAKWEALNMKNKALEIQKNLSVLDTFIENIEGSEKLKEVMASAQPKAKWEVMFNDIATKYLGYKPGDPDSEGMMASIKEWMAKSFGLDFLMKKTPPVAPAAANPQAPVVAQATPAATPPVSPTPAPAETPVVKNEADEKKLADNIKVYFDTLKNIKPAPTFEEVVSARKGKNKLFESIKGEDPEAQEKAVNDYLTEKFSKIGDVEEIKSDEIIFKAKDGSAEKRRFKIKKETNGHYMVSKGNGVPVEFDGDIDSLIEGIVTLEKPATT